MALTTACALLRPAGMVIRPADEYQKKVAEIALKQCRCDTGADLVTEKPRDPSTPAGYAQAA